MADCIERIERFITQRCGVDFRSKSFFFKRHLLRAMENLGINECERFYLKLHDRDFFQKAISHFMVSQSFFNRESRHFEILIELLQKDNYPFVKILSIPCANGEEPYTIALYLLENGIENFTIEAIDINPEAIQRAKSALYPKRSISYLPKRWIDRYFYKQDDFYRLDPRIASCVNFSCANLFDLDCKDCFDAIFCRNLLIYLDPIKKQEAMERFFELLRDGGYLFLSFSDYVDRVVGFDTISLKDKNIYKKRAL